MNNVHYNVDGLFNTHVKTQVKNALEELDGVQRVNIDLHQSTIEVDFNETTTENEIQHKIQQVGCKIQ
jgi:copper chaperone